LEGLKALESLIEFPDGRTPDVSLVCTALYEADRLRSDLRDQACSARSDGKTSEENDFQRESDAFRNFMESWKKRIATKEPSNIESENERIRQLVEYLSFVGC
jgi:hypothetical protein